jgi:DNA polymerase
MAEVAQHPLFVTASTDAPGCEAARPARGPVFETARPAGDPVFETASPARDPVFETARRGDGPVCVRLATHDDWDGFLAAATDAAARAIDPGTIRWEIAGDDATTRDLFGTAVPEIAAAAHRIRATNPNALPHRLEALLRCALLHADPARFVAIHRLVARVRRDRHVAADTLDPDRIVAETLARQVRREMHKMKAFVRFRPVSDDDGERFVAWFEPEHHVVRAVAPFFARRFAQMRWAILTPRGSVHWQDGRLRFAAAADRSTAPGPDAGEALWLDYYRSIFNPARVKLAMMRREMPVRYWRNLPEAAAIPSLVAAADDRTDRMVREADGPRARRAARCLPEAAGVRALEEGTTGHDADGGGTASDRLAALRRQASACDRCAFASAATQTVWGVGPTGAALMLVGEQPGDREDLEGRPFVGPAGQLLHESLKQLGWPIERLYLTNAVKHFRYQWRGHRRMHKTAAQRDAAQCADWLEQEIAVVDPGAIVALGVTAARSLLGAAVAVGDAIAEEALDGGWQRRSDGRRVLVCAHPAAVLRGAVPLARWLAQLERATTLAIEPRTAD